MIEVHNPSGMPSPTTIDHIEEPYIRAQIISKAEYIGPIIKLCLDKRGTLLNQVYIASNRVELTFDLPLGEIVFDFYDKLKSISKGYASFDSNMLHWRKILRPKQKTPMIRLYSSVSSQMVLLHISRIPVWS